MKPNIYVNNYSNHFYNTAEEYIFIFTFRLTLKLQGWILNWIRSFQYLDLIVFMWHILMEGHFWLALIKTRLTAASFLFIPSKSHWVQQGLQSGSCRMYFWETKGRFGHSRNTHSNIGFILKNRIRKVLISSYR